MVQLQPRCIQGVFEKHGDGHWSDTAGDRCNGCDMADCRVKVDIADQFVSQSINADIDYDGCGSQPVSANKVRDTHGCHNNVGSATKSGDIRSSAVTDGDCCVSSFLQQQCCHGFADDVAATNHNGVSPGRGNAADRQQPHDSSRSAWQESRSSLQHQSDIFRVKGIDILQWRHSIKNGDGIQMFGQGQLDKNSVDVRVVVE